MWSTSENLQETAEKNIRPMGENSPNLVALIVKVVQDAYPRCVKSKKVDQRMKLFRFLETCHRLYRRRIIESSTKIQKILFLKIHTAGKTFTETRILKRYFYLSKNYFKK
jgi:hypothetical protein